MGGDGVGSGDRWAAGGRVHLTIGLFGVSMSP